MDFFSRGNPVGPNANRAPFRSQGPFLKPQPLTFQSGLSHRPYHRLRPRRFKLVGHTAVHFRL